MITPADRVFVNLVHGHGSRTEFLDLVHGHENILHNLWMSEEAHSIYPVM